MKQQMSEFDVFYISYDEPNAEQNWADLLQKAPWAKRVHGVKGFDSAHKACAMQSETERFITVDGDNIVNEKFFDTYIDIPEKYAKCAFSWNSTNIVNGLVYGNGGLKLWTKDWVMGMKTHENAESDEYAVDFCWDNTYIQLNSNWSTTCPNGSALQAFRAGFREGCKMTLDQGAKVDKVKIQKIVHDANFKRLMIWACVGADVDHGLAAILGTRLGIHKTNIDSGFDISKISDYDWFKQFGTDTLNKHITNIGMIGYIEELGEEIEKHLGIKLCLYNSEQSAFFKSVYEQSALMYSVNIEKELCS